MIGTILVIALLSIAGSIIYYRSWEFLPFLFGVLLGTAASIVRVILLERSVEKISALSPQRAKNQIVAQQMGSMVLTLVVLLIAALVPQILQPAPVMCLRTTVSLTPVSIIIGFRCRISMAWPHSQIQSRLRWQS